VRIRSPSSIEWCRWKARPHVPSTSVGESTEGHDFGDNSHPALGRLESLGYDSIDRLTEIRSFPWCRLLAWRAKTKGWGVPFWFPDASATRATARRDERTRRPRRGPYEGRSMRVESSAQQQQPGCCFSPNWGKGEQGTPAAMVASPSL